jgi:hypothetical protein
VLWYVSKQTQSVYRPIYSILYTTVNLRKNSLNDTISDIIDGSKKGKKASLVTAEEMFLKDREKM